CLVASSGAQLGSRRLNWTRDGGAWAGRSGAEGADTQKAPAGTRPDRGLSLEPMTGIEPAYSAWEADVLPLNYIGERRRRPLTGDDAECSACVACSRRL